MGAIDKRSRSKYEREVVRVKPEDILVIEPGIRGAQCPERYATLLKEIKDSGLYHKCLCMLDDNNEDLIMVDGHRRLRVAKELGYKTILCVVGARFR